MIFPFALFGLLTLTIQFQTESTRLKILSSQVKGTVWLCKASRCAPLGVSKSEAKLVGGFPLATKAVCWTGEEDFESCRGKIGGRTPVQHVQLICLVGKTID